MTYFDINNTDRVHKKSNIRQLVDILKSDIAGMYMDASNDVQTTNTRKKYSVFVTGGQDGTNAVTSGLYQTVFDQDHTFQTSNEMLDITVGVYHDSATVTGLLGDPARDSSGKLIFPDDTSLMMREKINIYKQYAQILLGNSESSFHAPFEDSDTDTRIDNALFLNFKRLFVRDGLEKEQFSIKLHSHLPAPPGGATTTNIDALIPDDQQNASNVDSFKLYSDANATQNLNFSTVSGYIGSIVSSADPTTKIGLIFYNKGIVVLDAEKIFDNDTIVGSISVTSAAAGAGDFNGPLFPTTAAPTGSFWQKASIDDLIDHIADTRFGRDNKSAIGFINQTSINSSIYFCRVGPNDANFSTNPTYIDEDGNIRCIQEKGDDPFTYITTIGLYDASGELLAVAKTSRPIEKNPEVDLSISVRLDY